MLCHVGDSGKIVVFAIFAKFASIANFYGAPHCFVLCHVGDSGKIVIFATFAKFASIANFYGPLIALCFAMLAILAKLSFLPYLPVSPTFMGPLIALCFALLVIVAILSFSPYLLKFASIANFYGAPHCFVLCPVGDSGKIVIFAIFAKFASIANFYGPLIALCFAMLAILAKLSFSPYLPNSPLCSLFCHFCCCVHFWTYLET